MFKVAKSGAEMLSSIVKGNPEKIHKAMTIAKRQLAKRKDIKSMSGVKRLADTSTAVRSIKAPMTKNQKAAVGLYYGL